MTTENEHENGQQGQPGGEPAPETAAPPPQSGAETPAAEAAPLPASDETAKLKAEVADLKDRLLRAHAEMDNVRKRLEREKADMAKFAITKFARDIVGVGDNVQRAIDAVPHKLVEQDPALKSFVEGVTMIEREFLSVLGRHGVTRLDPKGQPFNPHHHQAVIEAPAPDVPSGTVTQVFQAGYLIEDRILRPAMVAVARGGMKPQPPAEAAPEGASVGAEPGASNGGNGNGPQT